jgi:glucose-6-phosphate isomerase
MKSFSIKNKILCFDHDPNIGGRFSIFSITALLPLIVMGYSLNSLLKSFTKAKMKFLNNYKYLSKLTLSNLKFEDSKNITSLVGLSYHDRINVINEWYRQIFAESLGKNKKAKNYISSYGPIDQHSQFQLYIDGPYDKQFIFFSIASKVSKFKNNNDLIRRYNLTSVLERGAITTLKQKKFLVNQITIEENLIDYTYLLIYLIFDIFLRAKVSKINFLDQPAVEILKKNTRA